MHRKTVNTFFNQVNLIRNFRIKYMKVPFGKFIINASIKLPDLYDIDVNRCFSDQRVHNSNLRTILF